MKPENHLSLNSKFPSLFYYKEVRFTTYYRSSSLIPLVNKNRSVETSSYLYAIRLLVILMFSLKLSVFSVSKCENSFVCVGRSVLSNA